MFQKYLVFVLFFSLQTFSLELQSASTSWIATHNLFGVFRLPSQNKPIVFVNQIKQADFSMPRSWGIFAFEGEEKPNYDVIAFHLSNSYSHLFSLYGFSQSHYFDIVFAEKSSKKPLCFPIENIEFVPLQVEEKDIQKISKKFLFATKISQSYLHTCIGSRQINELLTQLNLKAIQKGYVTTRFGLLPQELNTKNLKLGIEVGFVGEVEYSNEEFIFSFAKDFGVKKGDVLNLETLELGITNLKRLKHLSPTAKIIPIQENSKSKISIAMNAKSLPIFIQTSFDNGGNVKDGYQATFLLGIENPLRLVDSLQIYLLGSLPFSKTDHSYYASLSYSLPIKRFLIQIDSSYAHNANQLSFYGISPVYSGNSINVDTKLSYLFYANMRNEVSFGLGVSRRSSQSYLEDIKLDVQTKILSEISSFVSYKRYFDNSQFSVILSVLQGVPLFGSNKSFDKKMTYLYTIPSVNLYSYNPFSLWEKFFVHSSAIKTQISRDKLYASEKMAIGGRYSVRGFNHFSLSAQMGVLYRNDLMAYLPSFWGITLAPSLGIDMGYVRNLAGSNENAGFLSGGGLGVQLFSKYFNAQLWGYTPFYNPYNAPTQNLFFSTGLSW